MPNKQAAPTGDPTGAPFPPQNPPPSTAFAPPMPTGDDGPIPDSEQKEEAE